MLFWRPLLLVGVYVLALYWPSAVLAGGFALIGQSARSAGTAYAGSSALAGGPDTVFYNPSGMAFIDERIASLSGDLILPHSNYSDGGSTDVLGLPRNGVEEDGSTIGIVPSAYAVFPFGDGIRVGVAVNAPFGQRTEYDANFIGRYEALTSELNVIDFGIAAAFPLNEHFAVGGGLDLVYVSTGLSNAIDFGAVCLGVIGPDCLSAGLAPQSADGKVNLDADGVTIGFNLGVMARFDRTRVGLAFRAPLTVPLSGTADFSVPPEAMFLTAEGAFTDTDISTELDLPATISLGAAYDVTDEFTVLAQVIWTGWSVVDQTTVRFSNPAQPDSVIQSDWDNSFYFALGGTYDVNEKLTLRTGMAYDMTPLSDRFRDPRLPGASTFSIAAGAGFQITPQMTLDFAYQHFFFEDAPVDISSPVAGRLVGSFENSTDVLSFQVSRKF